MNLDKITYRIFRDLLAMQDNSEKSEKQTRFIVRMMISLLTDEQKEAVLDEMMNEREHIEFMKHDKIWFDPKDNKYELKDCYEEDMMKDKKLMDEDGNIMGMIINDNNYYDKVNPYATQFVVNAWIGYNDDGFATTKEIRVKRSNIIRLWKPIEEDLELEDLEL